MHAETRKHYDLEGLWGDAKPVKPARARKPAAKKARKA
jgi:ribosomal silencing factor RsfS